MTSRRRLPALIAVVVAVGLLCGAASAQAPADGALYGQSWAVVVGVDRFKHRTVSRLNYAANDARSVAKALVPLGFPEKNITMLLDEQATRGAIERVLSSVIRRAAGPNDRLVIFFATHGLTLSLPGGGEEGYLLPHDGDPEDLPLTALAMQQLKQIGQRIPAKHILIAVDACYGGFSLLRAQAPAVTDRRYLELVGRSRVMQVLAAGRKDEPVIEERGHGVFTRKLIDGLEGHADDNRDGLITLSELGAWMHPRVAQASDYKQDMQWGSLDGEGQFVFVLPPRPGPPVAVAPAPPPSDAPRAPQPPAPAVPAPAPAPPPAVAALPPAPGPGDVLVGTWEGSITSQWSRGAVRLVITRRGDDLEGTLVLGSVTAEGRGSIGVGLPETLALSQHAGAHPVRRVRITGRAVGFVAAGAPEDLAVDGELSRNGRVLTGSTRAGGFAYDLRLQRK
jgi:hypothetical protein